MGEDVSAVAAAVGEAEGVSAVCLLVGELILICVLIYFWQHALCCTYAAFLQLDDDIIVRDVLLVLGLGE